MRRPDGNYVYSPESLVMILSFVLISLNILMKSFESEENSPKVVMS